MMLENKGGRGNKAKYPTKTMRVPEILEGLVAEMIKELYEGDFEQNTKPNNHDHKVLNPNQKSPISTLPDKQELIDISNKILTNKKGAKVSLEKLLQVLYEDNEIKL
jgi:hypothetical protein